VHHRHWALGFPFAAAPRGVVGPLGEGLPLSAFPPAKTGRIRLFMAFTILWHSIALPMREWEVIFWRPWFLAVDRMHASVVPSWLVQGSV
jgi:hypothetical protein